MDLRRYFEWYEIVKGDQKLKAAFHESVVIDKKYSSGICQFSNEVTYDEAIETYFVAGGVIDPYYGGNDVVFSFPRFASNQLPIDKYKTSIENDYKDFIISEDATARFFLQKLTELNRYYNILTNDFWVKYPELAIRLKELVQWISDLYGTHITKFPVSFNPELHACFGGINIEVNDSNAEHEEQRAGVFNGTAYFKYSGDRAFLKNLYNARIGSTRIINHNETTETTFIRLLTEPFKTTTKDKIHFGIASNQAAYILLNKLQDYFQVFDVKTLQDADCFRNKLGKNLIPDSKIFNQYLSNLVKKKKADIDASFQNLEQ